ASSLVDLTSTTLGFLMPRMTTAQRNAIATPATGLQVYNTSTNTVDYYNGGGWQQLATGASALNSLNGLTAVSQTFAVGTAGTDFNVSSTGSVHTFNIPTASAVNRGLLTSSDYTYMKAKLDSLQVDPPMYIDTSIPVSPIVGMYQAGAAQDGYLKAADWTTFNSKIGPTLASGTVFVGNGSNSATQTTITGDASLASSGALTLASVGTAGTYGVVTTDAKGRVTSGTVITNIANGGTGLATVTSGALLLGNGTNPLSPLAAAASGTLVVSNGSSWVSASANTAGLVDLTSNQTVSGTKSMANIYVKNQNEIRFYDSTSAHFMSIRSPASQSSDATLTLPTSAGSNGQVLVTDGTGVLSWTSSFTNNLASGNIFVGNGSGVATSVSMTGDATLANTGAITLASTGTAGTYGVVTTDAKGRVTSGTVITNIANGGTGLATATSGAILLGNGTNPLSPLAAAASGTLVVSNGSSWVAGTAGAAGLVTNSLASGNILVGNGSGVATSVSMTGDATLANTGAITLASTGTAGTYGMVTTDAKGRVTSGTVIEDVPRGGTGLATVTSGALLLGNGTSPLSPLAAAASGTLVVSNGSSWVGGSLAAVGVLSNSLASGNIYVGNGSGIGTSVSMTGDATLSNAGVITLASTGTAGTYGMVTTDAKGRVTSGTVITATANGGTGVASPTGGSIMIGNGASPMSTLAGGTIGNMVYATGASTWSSGSKDSIGIFANGGNTFAATATIGTKDSNVLNFMTAGNTRASISTTGAFSISSDTTLGVASGTAGAAPTTTSKLTVNGQAYSNVQYDTTNTTLSWNANNGNVMRWTPTTTATTANITNMQPGGAYMLIVKGGGTGQVAISCNGNAPSATSFVPANGSRVNGSLSKTVYTLMWDGTDCLVTWITGF
ncbi:MAG: beta strand repeat-containing protein, partial [Pseudobdellovibrio sp.]